MKSLLRSFVACALLVGFIASAHGSWHVMSAGGKNYITNDVAEGESPWRIPVTVSGKTLSIYKNQNVGVTVGTSTTWDFTDIADGYYLIKVENTGQGSDKPTFGTLRKIVFPTTLRTIGGQAFRGYGNVVFNTDFFPSLTWLGGNMTFRGCWNLKGSVVLRDMATALGSSVFASSGIESIEFGEGLTAIPSGTCNGCTSLTNVVMRGAVTSIGDNAFNGCSKLKEYTYSSYPVTFGSNWIKGGKTGTGVRAFVPKSNYGWRQVMADSTAFTPWADCADKQQAYFDAFGEDAQEPVGYTTVPMAMWLLTYDDGGTVETYAVNVAAVPGDCSVTTNIQPGADGKYEVGTDSSFTAVGDDFVRWYGDVDLAQVSNRTITLKVEHELSIAPYFKRNWTVNGSKMSDGYWTLNISGSLESGLTVSGINVKPKVRLIDLAKPIEGGYVLTGIGQTAFGSSNGTGKGEDVLEYCLPPTITSIGNMAFRSCTQAVFDFDFSNVRSIGATAFASCSKLTGAVNLKSATSLDTGVFANTSVGSVTVGDELTSVPQQFCQNVSTLTSVSFGKSVSSIGWASFQKCGNLREYSFASYPSFVDGWNLSAKTGTGVRAFVPKDVEGWANILANSEVFTPWKKCTTSQTNDYYKAFGPTAQRPRGYTTVPMAMWLVTYNLKGGMKLVFR